MGTLRGEQLNPPLILRRRVRRQAAPKEQPTRNLSGHRTAGRRHSWKEDLSRSHRRGNGVEPASLRFPDSRVSGVRHEQRTLLDTPRNCVESQELDRTPLYDLHLAAGARMAGFAGFDMPMRYEAGALAEHLHTRGHAGLFDISHMGLVEVTGPDHRSWLETVLPTDITGLVNGQMRYSFFTLENGGVLDDVMITGRDDRIDLVVNASRKAEDLAHLAERAPGGVVITPRFEVGMLALQGPEADAALSSMIPELPATFLRGMDVEVDGLAFWVSRSGYTGEDGFEIQGTADAIVELADRMLGRDEVAWAGLAARDSLRLEAGLCLYGHDLSDSISPIEAGLRWAIPKRRRDDGGYIGADVITRHLKDGPPRIRIGLKPQGRAPVREGAILVSEGTEIGFVSSGGYGPSVEGPIAMGYVDADFSRPSVTAQVRSKEIDCDVVELPFVTPRYVRGIKP